MLPLWQDQPHIFCTTCEVQVVPLWCHWVLWVKKTGISFFHENHFFFKNKSIWRLLCSKAMTIFQCFWGNGCCGRTLTGKQCPVALPKHNVHMGVQKALGEVAWIILAVLLSAITRFPFQSSKPLCVGFVCPECRSDGLREPWAASPFSFFLLQHGMLFPVLLNFAVRHVRESCK